MTKFAASEEIVIDLSRSGKAYGQRMAWKLGPLVWARPASAFRGLLDAFPVEALLISIAATLLLIWRFGSDLGGALSVSVALVLVAAQLMKERTYGTATHLVRRRGLIFMRSRLTAWRDVVDLRVEGDSELGDLVLTGAFGEYRIRAVDNPFDKQHRIRALVSHAHRVTA